MSTMKQVFLSIQVRRCVCLPRYIDGLVGIFIDFITRCFGMSMSRKQAMIMCADPIANEPGWESKVD
jgi:hypothetical protein